MKSRGSEPRIATAKQTYQADEALFDTRAAALAAVPGGGAGVVSFVADAYWLYLACLVAINVASATGLNILTGYTGLVSLGRRLHGPGRVHGGGAGAAAGHAGAAQPAGSRRGGDAGRAGGGRAVAAGEGLYLAISTIAASFIAHFIFANGSFTGGTAGLQVPPARLFGVDLDTSFRIYWLIVPLTALMVLGAANLFRTRIGRAFIAIRDRDISAEVLGIRLLRCCCPSACPRSTRAWPAVCGPTSSAWSRRRAPLIMSIFFLAAVIVGGMGSILAPSWARPS